MSCQVALTPHAIDFMEIQKSLRGKLHEHPHCGGLASFEGIVRNHNLGHPVKYLEYLAYEPLALSEMKAIAQEASLAYNLKYVHIIHRTGKLFIGETAVLIHVLTAHRAEAFAGCRMIIDQIKARVPIWKKEQYLKGEAKWVQCSHLAEHQEENTEAF